MKTNHILHHCSMKVKLYHVWFVLLKITLVVLVGLEPTTPKV